VDNDKKVTIDRGLRPMARSINKKGIGEKNGLQKTLPGTKNSFSKFRNAVNKYASSDD
jgi:hypothetical protein